MTNAETVQALFDAYLAQDRATVTRLLADDFVFTSPQDDHIDRAAYLERCFPTAHRFRAHTILELAPTVADGVFVLYQYELQNGERYRNAERLTVRDGQIVETQVFFGGRAPQ